MFLIYKVANGLFLLVNNTEDDDGTPVQFKVTASQEIEIHDGMFVVFLMNITTQKRIWNSLHKHANLDIIKEILYPDSMVRSWLKLYSYLVE